MPLGGSGAFLVKAMCNMMKEAGGVNTDKASKIKSGQLFGIEMYNKVFALACANMMFIRMEKQFGVT